MVDASRLPLFQTLSPLQAAYGNVDFLGVRMVLKSQKLIQSPQRRDPPADRTVTVVKLQTFYEIADRFRREWEWLDFSLIAPIDK